MTDKELLSNNFRIIGPHRLEFKYHDRIVHISYWKYMRGAKGDRIYKIEFDDHPSIEVQVTPNDSSIDKQIIERVIDFLEDKDNLATQMNDDKMPTDEEADEAFEWCMKNSVEP